MEQPQRRVVQAEHLEARAEVQVVAEVGLAAPAAPAEVAVVAVGRAVADQAAAEVAVAVDLAEEEDAANEDACWHYAEVHHEAPLSKEVGAALSSIGHDEDGGPFWVPAP